ncbi:MAG: Thioredoxin protein EC-YbbN [Micavibrio sp.]|nr:Thioredoxin protein EC-YbbN [Micavibrio sp.]
MLIGSKNPASPATAIDNGENIFDVTTANFEDIVLKASMETPILVDFWAPWCEPCKQLGPILEAAVTATNGKVRMAKINIDENQQLAQAMRVQSIPTVYAFFQGQPVTAFTGVKPASEIKMLVDQLSAMARKARPDAINIPETLSMAAKAMAEGHIEVAQGMYMQIMAQDENNADCYAGLVRSFIALGDLDQAGFMLEDAPEEVKKSPAFAAARTALDLVKEAPEAGVTDKLAAAIEKDPADHQSRFDYAVALFAAGQKIEGIEQLVELIRRDRANERKWEEDKAKTQLFKFFEALGPSDPVTLAGRRKLSSVLFS